MGGEGKPATVKHVQTQGNVALCNPVCLGANTLPRHFVARNGLMRNVEMEPYLDPQDRPPVAGGIDQNHYWTQLGKVFRSATGEDGGDTTQDNLSSCHRGDELSFGRFNCFTAPLSKVGITQRILELGSVRVIVCEPSVRFLMVLPARTSKGRPSKTLYARFFMMWTCKCKVRSPNLKAAFFDRPTDFSTCPFALCM